MRCSNCHIQIADGSAFCNKCGNPVKMSEIQQSSNDEIEDGDIPIISNNQISENTSVKEPNVRKQFSKKNRLILCLIVILTILFVVTGNLTDYTFSYKQYLYNKYIEFDDDGNNALLRSVIENELVKTQELLDLGLDPNLKNIANDTPLIIGVRNNNIEVVKYLLMAGAEIEAVDNNKNTPLILAAQNGNVEICKVLMNSGAKLNARNDNSDTVLTLAIKKGDLNYVKLFVENGIRVDSIDKNLDTPFLIAVKLKRYDIIEFLLTKKIQLDIKDINENTAYHLAGQLKDGKIMDLILKYRKSDIIPLTMQKGELTGTGFNPPKPVEIAVPNNQIFDFYSNVGIKVLLDKDGNKVYQGEISNGRITGYGTAYTTVRDFPNEANQKIYEGYWKNGIWEGSGKSYWLKTSLDFLRSNISSTWGSEKNALEFYNRQKNTVFYDTTYVNGYRNGFYTRYYSDGTMNDTGSVKEGNNNSNVYKNEPVKKSPTIGMSAIEVEKSSWGKPDDVNTTTTIYGTREQWVYSGYRYLYFENGILTTIQN